MSGGHIAASDGVAPLPWREVLARPLPFQAHSVLNRTLARLVCTLARDRVRLLDGLEQVAPVSVTPSCWR